jgi:hypothetical protein
MHLGLTAGAEGLGAADLLKTNIESSHPPKKTLAMDVSGRSRRGEFEFCAPSCRVSRSKWATADGELRSTRVRFFLCCCILVAESLVAAGKFFALCFIAASALLIAACCYSSVTF